MPPAVRDTFAQFDRNRNGYLERGELSRALDALGFSGPVTRVPPTGGDAGFMIVGFSVDAPAVSLLPGGGPQGETQIVVTLPLIE